MFKIEGGHEQIRLQIFIRDGGAAAQVAKNIASGHETTVLLHQIAVDWLFSIAQELNLSNFVKFY
jgi:hypothetical protein